MIDKPLKIPFLLPFVSNVVTYIFSVATATKDKTTIHEIFMLIMHESLHHELLSFHGCGLRLLHMMLCYWVIGVRRFYFETTRTDNSRTRRPNPGELSPLPDHRKNMKNGISYFRL